MKLLRVVTALFAVSFTAATYSGDVVEYWIDQTSMFINGTIGPLVGGLQTPSTCWVLAVTSASMYNAAVKSENENVYYQQIAVSHAAHGALTWIFQGARLSPYIDDALKNIQYEIMDAGASVDVANASSTGSSAASEVITTRTNDGMTAYVDYTFGPAKPGIYELTNTGYGLPPDGPQVPFVRMFSNSKPPTTYLAPAPPQVTDSSYEQYLAAVKSIGFVHSTTRTQDQTNIALFWEESAPIKWNRFANILTSNYFVANVQKAAKLRAQLNYAMFNAAVASWISKFHYNSWRPETALHYPEIFLSSGHNLTQPDWKPLINPTPIEQEYTSGHATTGGAAGAVLKAFNGGDEVNLTVSAVVPQSPGLVLTRHFTNLTAAAQEISDSRFFGGIHFTFATDNGMKVGNQVALDTLASFDSLWNKF